MQIMQQFQVIRMTTNNLKPLVVLLLIIVLLPAVLQGKGPGKIDAAVYTGLALPSSPEEFRRFFMPGFSAGLGIGYEISRIFKIQGSFFFDPFYTKNRYFGFYPDLTVMQWEDIGVDLFQRKHYYNHYSGGLELIINLSKKRLSPYISIGPGVDIISRYPVIVERMPTSMYIQFYRKRSTHFTLSGALGLKLRISKWVSLIAEIRHKWIFDKYFVSEKKAGFAGYIPIYIGIRHYL
jgi:hypothetical protein